MGADQLAAIRPALVEVYDAPTDDWCATLEIPGTDFWVQVVRGTLNASYPHTGDPLERFKRLASQLPDVKLTDWEADTYATFSHGECSPRDLAKAVDFMLLLLLGDESADYELDVTMQQM